MHFFWIDAARVSEPWRAQRRVFGGGFSVEDLRWRKTARGLGDFDSGVLAGRDPS